MLLFQKINNCTSTCQHRESFSIYGYPDHVSSWISKIKDLWGSPPSRLKGSSSHSRQFGNKTESIFRTIYYNGTIHIQGIMAVQYSTEVIQPLLKTVFYRGYTTIAKDLVQAQHRISQCQTILKPVEKGFGAFQRGQHSPENFQVHKRYHVTANSRGIFSLQVARLSKSQD